MLDLKLDCRHLRGEKPCRLGTLCQGCSGYEPMGTRILVVKLDAVGDVARTTTILRPLRQKYSPCHVTWLAAPPAFELVSDHPRIEVPLAYGAEALARLAVEKFDLVLSLDKTPRATAVGMGVGALKRLGFGLSEFGTVFPLDERAEYAYRLGIDDDLKFRDNDRTYQDVIFEVCGLSYEGQEYDLPLDAPHREFAGRRAKALGLSEAGTLLGLNMGGGAMFAHKMWDAQTAIEFIRQLQRRIECKIALFGAERERDKIEAILAAGLPWVVSAGLDNSLKEFQALVGLCDVLVGGDSLGMHMAIAERVPQVVLFGPTCPREIELYGRGEKLVSPVDCGPCYRKTCENSPSCMEAIAPADAADAVARLLRREERPE